ncbi:MAG: hypothetical protein IT385_03215 [Deltaproteobacteria bacterium]|nr:hypothetical protein [Deltaproteobacteria bacterium]
MTRSLARAALALLVALATAPARAETDDQKKARAFETFGRGEAQFERGHFDAAARLFEEAWSTWRDPAYLFNIGLAFEKAERWPLAVEWYGRFLEAYPAVPQVSEVRRRHDAAVKSREAARAQVHVTTDPAGARAEILDVADVAACVTPCVLRVDAGPITVRATLGARTAEAARSVGPSERWDVTLRLADVATDPDPPRPPAPDRTGPIVSWAIGGAALVTGVAFGVMASDTYDEGRALADKNGGLLERGDYDRLAGLREDLERESLVADVGFATALVGGAIGLVLWLTADAPASTPASDRRPGSATWRF